ncbi:MAG: amino acid permease [Myxococcota bacterium]|nr:amino acid permease [Myxococcota bacterium]
MNNSSSADAMPTFDTFAGVTRPVLLTTLGALLFLREGWLVGNSGLLGAVAVILSAYVITGTTALSVSSLSTNVRIQAGGAFAIIAQALGLEAGGAIGIPLFIAQCASAALYLFAFGEVWLHLFPGHPIAVVVFSAFAAVSGLTMRSASVAFKVQAPLLVLVAVAIGSVWTGGWGAPPELPDPGAIPDRVSLREAFAVFFPAATGLMVGVGMSGSLRDPKTSIPKGILTAWGVSLAVYLISAVWCHSVASPDQLLVDKTIMIRKASVGTLVLVGVLCSTFMAAASNLVAAPRLLAAMAEKRVVPYGGWIAETGENGEPRRALWVAMVVSGVCLFSGSLDQIAQIVTAFFVLTYLAINLVVFLEQRLAMISFRPTLRIHRLVPLVGVVASVLGLFVSSPTMGLVGGSLVVVVYVLLQRRQLETPWDTVRSGIHVRVAAWAAQKAGVGERPERAWTPEMLLPVQEPSDADVVLQLAQRVASQAGSIRLVGMRSQSDMVMALGERTAAVAARGVAVSATVVDADRFGRGVALVIDANRGMFMGPNLILTACESVEERDLQLIVDQCHARRVGMGVFVPHPEGALGRGVQVTVWLSERSPEWKLDMHNANLDLPVLFGHLLGNHPGCSLRLATVVRSVEDRAAANAFLQRLVDQGRLGNRTELFVGEGDFMAVAAASPYADIHRLGLPPTIDRERLMEIRDACGGACLFLLDSGQESILA